MRDLIKRLIAYLNKDITDTIKKYKLALSGFVALVLLACVGMFITYAYYQTNVTTPVIGGVVGKIADLDIRVMAEDRDSSGNGLGTYSIYPYIPRAGYRYLPTTPAVGDEALPKSYCVNGSIIDYSDYNVEISASAHDVCYLYFKSTAALDMQLDVYLQNVNEQGEAIANSYTKLETANIPSIGYGFNASRSGCDNNSTLTYNDKTNMFTINSTVKDKCVAYMDALDIDVAVKLYVQEHKGSSEYYEATSIPHNYYYKLSDGTYGHTSSCVGASGTNSLTFEKQQFKITAGSRTRCVVYLDVDSASGPIIESMVVNPISTTSLNVGVTMSNAGTIAQTYYYSKDGGLNFVSSSSNTYTFTTTEDEATEVLVYAVDANDKTSAVVPASFYGIFTYSNKTQVKIVPTTGYYKLQVWGAQGGYRTNSSNGGKGGYSYGTIHLNAGDTLYVHTGGFGGSSNTSTNAVRAGGYNGGGYRYGYPGGGGATDIRIKPKYDALPDTVENGSVVLTYDSLYARVIVAGGGGSDGAIDKAGYYGGGATGGSATEDYTEYGSYCGKGGGQTYSGYGVSYTINSPAIVGLNSNSLDNYAGGFGFGGGGVYLSDGFGGAGGGGWYGGAGTIPDGSLDNDRGGGGGSGWVYTEASYNNWVSGSLEGQSHNWLLPNTYYLTSAQTIPGNTNVNFASPGGSTETGHAGNGYALVTYCGLNVSDCS